VHLTGMPDGSAVLRAQARVERSDSGRHAPFASQGSGRAQEGREVTHYGVGGWPMPTPADLHAQTPPGPSRPWSTHHDLRLAGVMGGVGLDAGAVVVGGVKGSTMTPSAMTSEPLQLAHSFPSGKRESRESKGAQPMRMTAEDTDTRFRLKEENPWTSQSK
jgi:hypothetical protein